MTTDIIIYDLDHRNEGEWKTYYHVSKTDFDLDNRLSFLEIPLQEIIKRAHNDLLIPDPYEREVYSSHREAFEFATKLAGSVSGRKTIYIHLYTTNRKAIDAVLCTGATRYDVYGEIYRVNNIYIYDTFKVNKFLNKPLRKNV